MSYIVNSVLDAALNTIKNTTGGVTFYIANSYPTNTLIANALQVAVGNTNVLTGSQLTGPADGTSGRELTITGITSGNVVFTNASGSSPVTHWFLANTTSVLVVGNTASTYTVEDGNTFSVNELKIRFPDPAGAAAITDSTV